MISEMEFQIEEAKEEEKNKKMKLE